ncbi:glycosyltransferase family 4 protein [Baaleninema simplex]|uniref:glycosyltransferase family 4 protein n=1 Tax=Baaleninema simplex TaxID=2862350 RepID=UPI00034AD257|nr:glycosyltransferase family 4 protein [Baaleninema simplex]
MHRSAAIFYIKDGYDTSGKRLLGRQSAGEGFLKGLARYSQAETLYCSTPSEESFREFCDRVRGWTSRERAIVWLPSDDPTSASKAGLLYHPSPGIGELAWKRRFSDPRTYSLCGITHTTASRAVMEAVSELLIAPVQPWDALICTSDAVKRGVEHLLDSWGDYLARRTGCKPNANVRLPVIPLGVDCTAFPQGRDATEARRRLRQELNVSEDDIAILFVGRLISYAKAHPVPMYLAVERAVRQLPQPSKQRVHLIQAGWFESDADEAAFKAAAKKYCPSANALFVDGRLPEIRRHIWTAADIFISLADNIQETFGLTPIEAMASGLPVVVSDWNGYKESVRHNIDGFRVPTLLPPPGTGGDLAFDYFNDRVNYSTFVGESAIATAIDIDACAEFLRRLMGDRELRQRLGENGCQRARQMYDWRVVIGAYEELWLDLARQRASQPMCAPLESERSPYPISDDPFRAFAHYPTQTLTPQVRLTLGQMASPQARAELFQLWTNTLGSSRRLSPEETAKLVELVKERGAISIEEMFRQWQISPRSLRGVRLYRTVSYLLKFDILKIESLE